MKGLRSALVLALMTAVSPVQARQAAAVNPQAYADAIEDYRNGRPLTEAVTTLHLWARKDFEAAVDRLVAARNISQLEAAAVFELEVGLAVMAISPDAAQIHYALGEKMLRSLAPTREELRLDPGRREDVERLSATWLGVAGSGYLWVTDTRRARPWIQKAQQLAPHSSVLNTLKGASHEIDAIGFDPDLVYTLTQKARAATQRAYHLALAQDAFRDAVEDDPLNARARIRLGRVLFLFNKIAQAREEIERGQALATKPADRYLAALFLGAIKERQKDLAGAREAYLQAFAIAPRSQTVTVALANLDMMMGRPDRAHAFARAFASAPRNDQAWWEYRNGGPDHDGLASLRARVRK
jgi:tetratricopeptide (TPR) repeat protein